MELSQKKVQDKQVETKLDHCAFMCLNHEFLRCSLFGCMKSSNDSTVCVVQKSDVPTV